MQVHASYVSTTESFTATLPEDGAWKASRVRDARGRTFEVAHSTNGVLDGFVTLGEAEGVPPSTPDEVRARLRKALVALLTEEKAKAA